LLIRDVEDFFLITAVVWLVSGLGTWIFGNSKSNHIGASGIVFGYLGFLISQGYFERSVGTIALSVLMLLIYGRMLWLVFPIRDKMSLEMHLFGFVGGVLAARYLLVLRQWFENVF
jgi:membrane associated rhomboid family serine protease